MAGSRLALQRALQTVAGTSAEPSFLGMLTTYSKTLIPTDSHTYTRSFCRMKTPGGSRSSLPIVLLTVLWRLVPEAFHPLIYHYSINAPAGSTRWPWSSASDTNYGFTTSSTPVVPDGENSVNIQVAGMKPKTAYHLRANVTLPDGTQQLDTDRVFTTGMCRRTSARRQVTVPLGRDSSTRSRTWSGSLTARQKIRPASRLTIAALDPAGNLIWYYDTIAPSALHSPCRHRRVSPSPEPARPDVMRRVPAPRSGPTDILRLHTQSRLGR